MREPDSRYNVLSTLNLARYKAPNVIGVLYTPFSCKGLLVLVQFYSTMRVLNAMCTPVFFFQVFIISSQHIQSFKDGKKYVEDVIAKRHSDPKIGGLI